MNLADMYVSKSDRAIACLVLLNFLRHDVVILFNRVGEQVTLWLEAILLLMSPKKTFDVLLGGTQNNTTAREEAHIRQSLERHSVDVLPVDNNISV